MRTRYANPAAASLQDSASSRISLIHIQSCNDTDAVIPFRRLFHPRFRFNANGGMNMIEIIPNWHPIFVHFTVALLFSSVIFFFLACFGVPVRWRDQWTIVAYWMLWAGAVISVITVAAGWHAFNTVKHDTLSHEAMIEHRNWAIPTFLYFGTIAVWAWRLARRAKPAPVLFLAAMVVGAGLLGATAWHGGELVYRYGLGVMSLPKPDGSGHAHQHDDGDEHDHAAAGIPPSSAPPEEDEHTH